jgi:hypothetical protein
VTAARFARYSGTVTIAELARVWKIITRALYDIINRQCSTGSAAALPRSGRPNVMTDADESVLAELPEELDGNYTWDEITKRFNDETGKVQQFSHARFSRCIQYCGAAQAYVKFVIKMTVCDATSHGP